MTTADQQLIFEVQKPIAVLILALQLDILSKDLNFLSLPSHL